MSNVSDFQKTQEIWVQNVKAAWNEKGVFGDMIGIGVQSPWPLPKKDGLIPNHDGVSDCRTYGPIAPDMNANMDITDLLRRNRQPQTETRSVAFAKQVSGFDELGDLISEASVDRQTWVRILIPETPLKFDVNLLRSSQEKGVDLECYVMKTVFDLHGYEYESRNGELFLIGKDRGQWSFGFSMMEFGMIFGGDPEELCCRGAYEDFQKDIATLSRWGVQALVHPYWKEFSKQPKD